jgi:tetratricopeptide (TPR) repeat protein
MTEVLDPKQIIVEAQAAYEAGDFLKAAHLFLAAGDSYDTVGNGEVAAEMANNQSVSLLQGGEAEKALIALDGKYEIFENAGNIRSQAITLGNRAAAFEALDRLEEAQADYQQAADYFAQIGERDLFVTTMGALSALQLRTGRSLEALATMQTGLNKVDRPNLKQRMIKSVLDIPFRLLNRR